MKNNGGQASDGSSINAHTNFGLTNDAIMFLLPTAREGNVFTGVCHSVHNRPHGYSFTAHPCYGAGGMHPTGMHSCFNQQFPIYDILRNGNFCLRHESSW